MPSSQEQEQKRTQAVNAFDDATSEALDADVSVDELHERVDETLERWEADQ